MNSDEYDIHYSECKSHWAGCKIGLAIAGFEPATFGMLVQ